MKYHSYPAVRVVFPVPSPSVLFNETIDRGSAAVVLCLQVYHCLYPLCFAEADIFEHTLREWTLNQTQAETYFQLFRYIFKTSLHGL